ncbi:MAG: hypothetical protein WB542_18110 [Polaromonas sp.]
MTPIPSMTGGAGGSAGPSDAILTNSAGFDSSGWNVNFGAGKIESSRGLDLGQYTPYVALAAAGIALWKLLKR